MNSTPSATASGDKVFIDTIVLLASLTSDPRAVDPILDILRMVTARTQQGQPMTDVDRRQLLDVKERLMEHLIHRDPVRSFTKERLDELIAERIDSPGRKPLQRKIVWQMSVIGGLIACTYLLSGLIFSALSMEYAWLLAGMVGIIMMYMGLAWFYWTGLRTFASSLRQAYFWIVVGIVLMGLNVAFEGIVIIFPSIIQDTILSFAGGFPVFAISFFFVYFGLRQYALTLGIRSLLTSLKVVMPSILLLLFLATFIPHTDRFNDFALDLGVASALLTGILGLLSGILAYYIIRNVTALYAYAVGIFGVGYFLSGIVLMAAAGLMLLTGPLSGASLLAIAIPGTVSGMLVFVSGYHFKISVGSS